MIQFVTLFHASSVRPVCLVIYSDEDINCSMAINVGRQEKLKIGGGKPMLHLFHGNMSSDKAQDVQLCIICFATDGNFYSLKLDKNLDQAYGALTGLSIENEKNMPPYLCTKCSHQLMHCIQFRNRSLRAHLLLREILTKYDSINLDVIKSINECQNFDELDTVSIKKESEYIEEQIHPRDEPRSLDHMVVNSIKKDDDSFSRNNHKDEDTTYSSILHEEVFVDDIKVESDDVYSKEGINDTHTWLDNMVNSDAFEGEDGSGYKKPLEVRQKAELSITKVKGGKTKELKQRSGGTLLLYDNLCCSVCSFKTISDVKLLTHLNTHSATARSKSYKSSYTVNIKQNSNTSVTTFCCRVCKETFGKRWDLQKHMKTHSGEKPYPCDVCKKSFKDNRDLQNHLRTHSGEKPYGCDLCKKSFSERGNLLRHIRIHSGAKPFSCEICKISFNQKHHLKRHLTRHY